MSRIPGGRRVVAGLLTSSLLMALAVVPGSPFHGTALAEETFCPEIVEEFESFGAPTCYLHIDLNGSTFPGSGGEGIVGTVPAGVPFTFDVRVQDSAGSSGNVVTDDCASYSTITVTLHPEFEPETIVESLVGGESATEDAANGIAEFTISVDEPGIYYFDAYADEGECESAVVPDFGSDAFEVTEGPGIVVTCPPEEACDTPPFTSESGQTTASIHAGPGATITAFFSTLDEAGFTECPDHPQVDPTGVLTFDVSDGAKTITFIVPSASNGKVCWNSPNPFTQRSGKLAPTDPAAPGTYTGVLPDCSKKNSTGPCVLKLTKPDKKAAKPQTTIEVFAPAGDPKMY